MICARSDKAKETEKIERQCIVLMHDTLAFFLLFTARVFSDLIALLVRVSESLILV